MNVCTGLKQKLTHLGNICIVTYLTIDSWIPNWVTNWATRLLPAEFESNICKGIQLKIEMGKKFEIFKDALFE